MVYLLAPHSSALQTDTTKFKQDFMGPLFIDAALDKTHYTAFTCNIILVITLMVFFIRYQKTMQAMLTAFITMNMSNSGILSTKANPISRTFPPLFMINISKEEKVYENLQEIESMQLIVQVIMVIVCILVAFIVLY